MSRHQGGRVTVCTRRFLARCLHRLLGVCVMVSFSLLGGACSSQRITQPSGWTCATTRPALDGTWVGTLDGAEIILQIVERECIGSLTFPYMGWPLAGSWTWKGITGQLSGGGPLAGTLSGPYTPSTKLTYGVTLGRGFDGSISLTLGNLPAGSTITAELSGVWTTPPTPSPGPLVLHRR